MHNCCGFLPYFKNISVCPPIGLKEYVIVLLRLGHEYKLHLKSPPNKQEKPSD